MSIYCTSDLHGDKESFLKLLKLIEFKENDKMIILGDILDRGTDGLELLDIIFKDKRMFLLKGNHEDSCVKTYMGDKKEKAIWYNSSGEVTDKQIHALPKREQKCIIYKLKNLPTYKKITVNNKNYLLVHAGIYPKPNIKFEELDEYLRYKEKHMLRVRSIFLKSNMKTDFKIVFGHTPRTKIEEIVNSKTIKIEESTIWKKENKIGIDCGKTFGGKLACIRLEDEEEFYIE